MDASGYKPSAVATRGVLVPGRNCWRVTRSGRLAFLVDGDAYFGALKTALSRAQRRIIILAWDFDNETLLRPHRHRSRRIPIGDFLLSLVRRRPHLEVYVLVWWGSIFYGANRDLPISFGTEWWSHPRIHFRLDDHHPVSASHHQKIVAIDDKVAFAGGMDITQARWDNTDHSVTHPHRLEGAKVPYGPTHDVQVMTDGETARAITAVAAERWRLVTGEILKPIVHCPSRPWPLRVRPDLNGASVAIARSQPYVSEQPEVREIETMNEDMLLSATRLIYIEQQYYTIPSTNEILCNHLQREDGPEIILVVNDVASGWIEQQAMFGSRDRLFGLLQSADRYRRLRLVTPVAARQPLCKIKVHSKIVVVDDRLLRIGSSNFNQRSLGLDTECDLIVEGDTADSRWAITNFAHQLMAEHLGIRTSHLSRALRRYGSYLRALDALNKNQRGLMVYRQISSDAPTDSVEALSPETAFFDPPRAIDLNYVFQWIGSRFRR